MDDMNAFERQVADEVVRASAPPSPVDVAAVFAAATSRRPRWNLPWLFGATRFVAAGIVVALFGGLLLAGILATPRADELAPAAVTPSPSASSTAEASADLGPASRFSGSWDADWQDDVKSMFWMPGPDYRESLDNLSIHHFEASDPRISGTWTHVMNARSFPIDEEAGIEASVWSGVVRIDNADGAWVGSFLGYADESGEHESYRLDGEGAYAGMTAVFGWTREGDTYDGVIIPGVPPAYPAPIAEPIAATGSADSGAIEVVVAGQDVVAGSIVLPDLELVPGSVVDPDVFTDLRAVKGHRAATDIEAGTPITPDLLEPLPTG